MFIRAVFYLPPLGFDFDFTRARLSILTAQYILGARFEPVRKFPLQEGVWANVKQLLRAKAPRVKSF